MGEKVRVHSIDALKHFKVYLLKFAEVANVALGDAESEMNRTLGWLELEQNSFWQSQIRKRGETVMRCKEAVRQKKIFKGSDGGRQSVVDEERALSVAIRKLEEAEQKMVAVRQHTRKLNREIQMFKGGVQRFATSVSADIPRACARLENMVRTLEQYLNLDFAKAWEMTESMGSFGRTSKGAGAGGGSVADLRKLTPSADVRAAAVQEEITTTPWAVGPIPPAEEKRLEGLITLQAQGATVNVDSRIVVGKGAFEAPRIYFEHVEPTGSNDTGWYVGPAADRGIISVVAVRVADLLAVRPDLRHVLTLPQGSLVVVNGGGMEAVYDSQGEDHWAAATAAEAIISGAMEAETAAAKPAK